jgi:hypothetical protein
MAAGSGGGSDVSGVPGRPPYSMQPQTGLIRNGAGMGASPNAPPTPGGNLVGQPPPGRQFAQPGPMPHPGGGVGIAGPGVPMQPPTQQTPVGPPQGVPTQPGPMPHPSGNVGIGSPGGPTQPPIGYPTQPQTPPHVPPTGPPIGVGGGPMQAAPRPLPGGPPGPPQAVPPTGGGQPGAGLNNPQNPKKSVFGGG